MKKICLFTLLFITITNGYSKETLRVSLPYFLPFYDQHNLNKGVVYEIFNRLAKITDIKFEIIPLPYNRMLNHLEKGDLDAVIIFKNESLTKSAHFLSKVSESEVSI